MARRKVLEAPPVGAEAAAVAGDVPQIDIGAIINGNFAKDGKYSFVLGDRDPEIIKTMKAMVDMEKFLKLLSVGGSDAGNVKFANREVADRILDAWAHNKYEHFILFGRRLMIEKEIMMEMDAAEAQANINQLFMKFPKYAFALRSITSQEFASNRLENLDWFARYYPAYKRGMSVTALFSALYNDKEFTDALADAMTGKKAAGFVCASIDPCDYLTASLNCHNWNSCFNVYGGFQRGGLQAWMTDRCSVIGYMATKQLYDYAPYGFKFQHNSKKWRQMFHLDLKSLSLRYSTQYPRDYNAYFETCKDMIKAVIDTYIPTEHEWVYAAASRCEMTKPYESYHYNEMRGYGKTSTIKIENKDKIVMDVTTEPVCVYCGANSKNKGQYACRACGGRQSDY